MKTEQLKKYGIYIYAFLASALLILICSKSSPLYPMNDWVDVHCFLTMGKSLLHGLVPYADLYEQKGPVLYFIYALVSMISEDSFFGVYLLETVTFGLFLLFSAKIVGLYTGDSWLCWLTIPLLGAAIVTSRAFCHGGSVEEICLFMMAYGLYTVLKAVKYKEPLSFREGFLNGLFAGMILWIKFTMLGFYVGLCLFVIIWYCISLRSLRHLLTLIGQFLLGVAAVTAVVLIFFVANGALGDLFTAYFYNNIFLYPNESDTSKLDQILFCIKWGIVYNPTFSWMLAAGLISMLIQIRKSAYDLLCVVFCFAGLTGLTYWGGKGVMDGYMYYDLVLAEFTMFAPVLLWHLIQLLKCHIRFPKLPDKIWSQRWIAGLLSAAILLGGSLIFAGETGRNVYLMDYEKQDMPQYRFAEIISQSDTPTLLNYGFLDGGFYYAADVIPNCKFFCTFNVAAPDMWQTQNQYIEEGLVEYVITRRYQLSAYGLNDDHYELVDEATMIFEGIEFTYYLYRLK